MNKASDIRLNHNGLMPTLVRVWEEYQGLLRFALAGIHGFHPCIFPVVVTRLKEDTDLALSPARADQRPQR